MQVRAKDIALDWPAKAAKSSCAAAEEERKSEALGVPVVLMLLAWVGFLGYPAVVNIIGL